MKSPDSALVAAVVRTVREQELFSPGDTLVVALSGGADSTALLDLLSQLPGYDLRLIAAHLNHCLRGEQSDADEQFCRDEAARHAIVLEVQRIDVGKCAAESRTNLEDAGRRERIRFLDEVARKHAASAVALAHHLDDQAETVLMRLLRGSGTTGLAGMAYRNARGYVRPLLDISRSDIEQYLSSRGLSWRDDASNSDTAYLRNRIRHQLLPLLEGYNPAIRSCLAATASLLGDDEALLAGLAERTFAELCREGEGEVVTRIEPLRALNPALRRRVLRLAFKRVAGTLEGLSQLHIKALNELVDSVRPNARLALPHAVAARREYDRLVLAAADTSAVDTVFELLVTEPGRFQLPGGGAITVEATTLPAVVSDDSGTLYLDAGALPFPWLIRTVRPGDRMTPFGMSGRKKVKDIFIDRKIPLAERKRLPLLWCGDDLIWIAGVCASELCRIDTAPTALLRVSWLA